MIVHAIIRISPISVYYQETLLSILSKLTIKYETKQRNLPHTPAHP